MKLFLKQSGVVKEEEEKIKINLDKYSQTCLKLSAKGQIES